MADPLCYLEFAANLYFRRVGVRWPRRPRGLDKARFLIKKPSVWLSATPDTSTSSNSSATQATPASQATPSASYAEAANVTQEVFTASPTEPSRKHAPLSPAKGERPAAKKSTQPSPAPPLPQRPKNPFLACFMKALTKSGSSRTRVMTKVAGEVYYNFRALHF